MANTPRLDSVSPKRQRIAELARQAPEMVFTSLAHHIDRDVLHAAYAATRKDGAVGLDGQTADDYAENLEANLQSLLDRFKSGQYVAPPVRRVHIPKGDGRTTRPIGIPTFEDKVLQRAVLMVLESVYEQDFRDCSFGFRPGRSAHQALQHLWEQTMLMGGGWMIDLDIQGFFDALDHSHLRRFLDQRVRDGVLRRAIDKWLKAGVLEDGRVSRSVLGTPQGGVVSPLLANIYLHHVLDVWFTTEVQPRLRGRSVLVRYADDVVIVVQRESDAHRGAARAPETPRAIRPHDASGEEPSGSVPPTAPWLAPEAGLRQSPTTRHVRLPGVHALLVHRPERQLGAQAQDGQGPPSAQSDGHQSLVRGAPPRVGRRAASDAGVEAAWALRLLRADGERPEPVVVQLSRRPHLAEVAQPSVTEAGDAVETVPPSPGPLPASADDSEPLGHPSVAKPSVEEPDAEEPACPDLWGAGVGNDPGLPDRCHGPAAVRRRPLRPPERDGPAAGVAPVARARHGAFRIPGTWKASTTTCRAGPHPRSHRTAGSSPPSSSASRAPTCSGRWPTTGISIPRWMSR